ncbi:MAG: hypothetical protein ACK52I_07585, partial [Pseudomonadota bacterium]
MLATYPREAGLADRVQPKHVLYPIFCDYAADVLLPQRRDSCIERVRQGFALHLWNEFYRRWGLPKSLLPPRGSFLRECMESEIGDPGRRCERLISNSGRRKRSRSTGSSSSRQCCLCPGGIGGVSAGRSANHPASSRRRSSDANGPPTCARIASSAGPSSAKSSGSGCADSSGSHSTAARLSPSRSRRR